MPLDDDALSRLRAFGQSLTPPDGESSLDELERERAEKEARLAELEQLYRSGLWALAAWQTDPSGESRNPVIGEIIREKFNLLWQQLVVAPDPAAFAADCRERLRKLWDAERKARRGSQA